ncbi:hypothetical protein [Pseudomonas sp. HS6]|uniref:hypothetical protein n=1 Tax=Pseudomonas sp. HS6 TaxID=2850559 RepID=UPI0020197E1E|nr:hypothetical protein [Pseudomonas sp. HS6]UQS13315.1 hypothetical protein JJN09_19055 [Pseudomonas sp. HS6]
MDENRAKKFADFLTNLHIANSKKIQAKQALRKFQAIQESPRGRNACAINYSSDVASILKGNLVKFLSQPRGCSAVLVLSVDEKHDWIRLIRFVARGGDEFNAETISLTGKGVPGYNGFGYRYEHPEDEGDEHNFFHVQPIVTTSAGESIPGAPEWLSHRFPTFYMQAENSYELGIYAVSSVCSWNDLQKYQSASYEDCWLLSHLISKGRDAKARNATTVT